MAIMNPDGKSTKYKVVPLKVKTVSDLAKEKEAKKAKLAKKSGGKK